MEFICQRIPTILRVVLQHGVDGLRGRKQSDPVVSAIGDQIEKIEFAGPRRFVDNDHGAAGIGETPSRLTRGLVQQELRQSFDEQDREQPSLGRTGGGLHAE